MEWPDKSRFEGFWVNDHRQKGKLYMPDENVYEGNFQNDKMHGVGKIYYGRDDVIYEGIFKNG